MTELDDDIAQAKTMLKEFAAADLVNFVRLYREAKDYPIGTGDYSGRRERLRNLLNDLERS